MSKEHIKITLDPAAAAIIADMPALPTRVLNYVAAGMKQENAFTLSHIQSEHMSGIGPFPPEEHRLGVRSEQLRASMHASEPTIRDSVVDSSIGSALVYASIHEFGGTIHKPERQAKVRLRLNADMITLTRQKEHPNLARFAKQKEGEAHKRFKEMNVTIGAHDIKMPERAYTRTGIAECAPNYTTNISRKIVEAWASLGH